MKKTLKKILWIIPALALFLAACGSDGNDSDNAEQTLTREAPTNTAPATTSIATTTSTTVPEVKHRISVVVDEDNIEVTPPEGNPDFKFGREDTVIIEVLSTVSEEVHIHGYDDIFFINDSAPAMETYTFFTHISGKFLVELEISQRKLFEFTVS